jgi:hypothetical protein
MSELFGKIPELLVELVKNHPIATVITGIVLLLLLLVFASLSKRNPSNIALWATILLLIWPLFSYFVAALSDLGGSVASSIQSQSAVFYQVFIHHPQVVLVHIAVWFIVLFGTFTFFLLRASDWNFHELVERVRESAVAAVFAPLAIVVILGFSTAKVHADLLDANTSAVIQK